MGTASLKEISTLALLVALVGCGGEPFDDGEVDPELTAGALSAARPSGESYQESLERNVPRLVGKEDSGSPIVYLRALPLSKASSSKVTVWTATQLQEGFALARDTRFLGWEPGFPRRPSFLYPDDGCFVRAEAMTYLLQTEGLPRPSKVFVFGNLYLTTSNALEGEVSWWYHVAPVVSSGGKLWVIDPSVDPTQPLTISAWTARQHAGSDPKVSFCNSYSYMPDGKCFPDPSPNPKSRALYGQVSYLDGEWDRQIDLGRNPKLVLGDKPPWALN